jgi:hypothetical protein
MVVVVVLVVVVVVDVTVVAFPSESTSAGGVGRMQGCLEASAFKKYRNKNKHLHKEAAISMRHLTARYQCE